MDKAEIKLIELSLGSASGIFQGDYPEVIKTAVGHNYGSVLGKLLTDTYCYTKEGISDIVVLEALLAVAFLHCTSNYCFVMHSLRLTKSGLDVGEVVDLFDSMQFSQKIKDSKKWSQVLCLTFDIFKNRTNSYHHKIEVVRKVLTKNEFIHYGNMLALIFFLEFITQFYYDEVYLEKEALVDCHSDQVKVLVKYYEEHQSKNGKESLLPVLVVCSYCNALKDHKDQWHKIIDILPSIPQNASFTHSICDDCLEKAYQDVQKAKLEMEMSWYQKVQKRLKSWTEFAANHWISP